MVSEAVVVEVDVLSVLDVVLVVVLVLVLGSLPLNISHEIPLSEDEHDYENELNPKI